MRLPEGDVFVHREAEAREEARVPADRGGVIHAGGLAFRPEDETPRGALDQALRAGLFQTPYGPGYYAGYTARTGLLEVADGSWQGDAWASEPERPKVAADPAPKSEPPKPEPKRRTPDASRWWNGPRWGGVFAGTVVTPFNPRGVIEGVPRRVTSNQFQGCLGADRAVGCSALRGFDVRWQYFSVGQKSKYPRALFYFRTGYHAGFARFDATAEDLQAGYPRSLGYFGVPLFLGGNIYLFDAFPVRPYAGLGFGLDVMRLHYDRNGPSGPLTRVVARPGFELHAGIEARITNRVAIVGEVQQLWSARKKIDKAPDFSNEGLTIITGVAIGFPLSRPDVQAMKTKR